MDLGQYNSIGEYCDPHTAFSVFLIIILHVNNVIGNGKFDYESVFEAKPISNQADFNFEVSMQ